MHISFDDFAHCFVESPRFPLYTFLFYPQYVYSLHIRVMDVKKGFSGSLALNRWVEFP
jgi:hypothetical protein